MNETVEQHLARLRSATTQRLGRADLPDWIERNTFINGKPFSFAGHEYQKRILLDESPEVIIRKSAQTGISEMSMRMVAGLMMIMPGAFRIGYTLPTATFAASYAQTRFNPIVQGSPALRNAITTADVDKVDVKTFGPGKEVYFKGSATGNAAISTTLDMLIHDEASYSDPEILGDYWSRVLHSPYKWRLQLSTPTWPGDYIDSAFQNSKRNWNFCRCQACNHRFIPDYYDHVVIPGWSKALDEITKDNLHKTRFQEAKLLCPKCSTPANLSPEYREWVCENAAEGHLATGFQVQPFDAPTIVTMPDLITASTRYASKSKFMQFSLGRPAADSENGLTETDLQAIGRELPNTPFTSHVIGIDLGLTCHFAVGGVDSEGKLGVVHLERVPLNKFRERYFQLCAEYRVSIRCSDIQPYTDLILSLSAEDPNLFGCSFVTRTGLELYAVKKRDEDVEHALAGVKQVAINRNATLDKILAEVRDGNVWVRKTGEWDKFRAHLQDMKRASATLRNGEFSSQWTKSTKGNDHYHFALLYLWIAAQMRGIAAGWVSTGVPHVGTFKLKGPAAARSGTGMAD